MQFILAEEEEKKKTVRVVFRGSLLLLIRGATEDPGSMEAIPLEEGEQESSGDNVRPAKLGSRKG